MRHIRSTPAQPVFYGQIHFGFFKKPFRTINMAEADVYGHRGVPRWWRNLRLKEWQHFGIIHDDFYCGIVVFDAKFMGISFVYVYHRATGKLIEHKHTTLKPGAIHVPEQLWCGEGYFRQPNYHVRLGNHLNQGFHTLHVDAKATNAAPTIHADLVIHEQLNQVQPLIAVLPVNDHRRPMYTHKVACPASGTLRVGDDEWALDVATSWALIDVQKTYYPHNAFWKWATFAGTDQNGVPIALNLTQNMIENDEEWNECCLWINGQLQLLSAARFTFDPANTQHLWHITTTDGRVDITFAPRGERADQIGITGLVYSDFHQPFGLYQGVIIDEAGEHHQIDGAFGVAEYHILQA